MGGAAQILFLVAIDSAGGAAEGSGGASLHFDENQDAAIAGDDVQFAAAGALMEVAGYNG